jgi:hypothetical protein
MPYEHAFTLMTGAAPVAGREAAMVTPVSTCGTWLLVTPARRRTRSSADDLLRWWLILEALGAASSTVLLGLPITRAANGMTSLMTPSHASTVTSMSLKRRSDRPRHLHLGSGG